MGADPSFHIIEELGPEFGLEGRRQLFHLRPRAFGALDVDHLIDLVIDFKFVITLFTPVQVYWHRHTPFFILCLMVQDIKRWIIICAGIQINTNFQTMRL
jgi:hypothetical protein